MTLPTDGSTLDPRLEAESVPLGDFAVSRVRLMDDARYAWIVLVPHAQAAVELTDLPRSARHGLMDEIAAASEALRAIGPCDKLNVGALGNIVRQLHIHVIARVEGDEAWPGPVWGVGTRRPYEAGARTARVDLIRRHLGLVTSA